MANIPVGNFGRSTPGQVSPGSASSDFGQGMARAIQGLGQTISAVGDYREQQKAEMARAKAVNEGYKHELFAAETVDEIRKKIDSGELKYQDAESYYDNKIGTFSREKIDGLDPVGTEHFDGLIARNAARYKQDVGALALKAEQTDYKNQFVQGLDTLGKQRQLPGADIEAINAKADVLAVMAKRAGIDDSQASKYIQDFKDTSWYQHASERAMKAEVSNDVAGLKQMQYDLTAEDGYYTGKMDTEKRNALLKSVSYDLDRIQQRQELAAQLAEVKAERALMQFDSLIATGATPSQEAIERARSAVQGTAFETEFTGRLKFAEEVQAVLKMPIGQQVELAARVEREAMAGADSASQVARAKQLSNAINANLNTLTKNPLEYVQNKTGVPVEDLPIDALTDLSAAPAAASSIAESLQNRAAEIAALEKQNGIRIDNALLKPHEAEKLGSYLASKEATIEEKQNILRSLRAVSGDDPQIYKAVLAQLAPKAPVMSYAGMVAATDTDVEYDAGLFSASQTFKPDAIASTILKGERVINDRSFEIPSMDKFQTEFGSQVGNAYRDRPDALQADLQAVRAYYVGAVSERDTPSKDINTTLMKEAIGVIVGASYEAGDTTVLAPFGMSESTFSDRLETAWQSSAPAAYKGTPLDVFGLRPVGSGKYAVFAGNKVLPGQNGQPLILDVGE